MRIALPSDDGINLAERTGRAAYLMIYAFQEGKINFLEKRCHDHGHLHELAHSKGESGKKISSLEKRHNNDDHHDQGHSNGEHDHGKSAEQLKDCDIFLIKRLGKHFRQSLDKAGIKYFRCRESEIEKAIQEYLAST